MGKGESLIDGPKNQMGSDPITGRTSPLLFTNKNRQADIRGSDLQIFCPSALVSKATEQGVQEAVVHQKDWKGGRKEKE